MIYENNSDKKDTELYLDSDNRLSQSEVIHTNNIAQQSKTEENTDVKLSQTDIINLKKFRQQMVIEKNLSSNTVNAYISDIKQFLLFEQNLEYKERAVEYMKKLEENKMKSASVLRKFTAIKQYCKFLDIYMEVQLPKIQSNVQITKYEDIVKMIKCARNAKEKAFLALMFVTGGRISEILSLKVQALQKCLNGNRAQNYFNIMGKGKKERIVFVTEEVKEILEEYLQERSDASFNAISKKHTEENEFTDKRTIGMSKNDINSIKSHSITSDKNPYLFPARIKQSHISRQWGWDTVRRIAISLGMPEVHPHSFRHAQAMMLLESGADLISIQKILGHAHLSTTERYLKLHWGHLVDGMSKHPLAKRI